VESKCKHQFSLNLKKSLFEIVQSYISQRAHN